MLQRAAKVFGIVFLIVGALGFVPPAAPNGYLLGLFQVDALHNLVHVLTGVVALIAAYSSERASRLFLQIFGAVYGLLAVLGFFHGDAPLFGLIAHNQADIGLHLLIALVALYLGFVAPRTRTERA